MTITNKITTILLTSTLLVGVAFAQTRGDYDPNQPSSTTCVDLVNNLRIGDTDTTRSNEVSKLQQFLLDKGLLVLSPSKPTGYFGTMTFNAAKKYQASVSLANTGYVGPLTRAEIKDETCNANVSDYGPSSTSTATTTSVVNGKCGDDPTGYVPYANSCKAGAVSNSQRLASGYYTWYCLGLNGGSTSQKCTNAIAGVADPTNPYGTTSPTTVVDRNASCTGTKPSGAGVKIFNPNEAAFGGGANATSWTYTTGSMGGYACYWTCESGYTRSGNSCTPNTSSGTATQQYCPDGTLKPTFVVGPSTGCEGHMGTNSSISSSGSVNTEIYTTYPSGSLEPQDAMNKRYSCSGSVPTYGQAGPLEVIGYQSISGYNNTAWRSLYSLPDVDRNGEAWKSCTWYCSIGYSWNGSRCISNGSIFFTPGTFKIGENLKGVMNVDGARSDSYYACMENSSSQNSCSNPANYTQVSKNPDWKLSGNTYNLRSDFRIENSYPTGSYTGYLAVGENGKVKDPYRTAQRYSFTVSPSDVSGSMNSSEGPRIYFYTSGKILTRGEIYSTDPDNTWTCVDTPNTPSGCSSRSNWIQVKTLSGWTRTSYGFYTLNQDFSNLQSGRYTSYVAIGQNGSINTNGGTTYADLR